MTSTRDPFPFPKLECDDDFIGARGSQQHPYGLPTHLSQQQDPWRRLYSKGTLASQRREIYNQDPQAPNDSLDFVIKANYDQHTEFLKNKNETLVQEETLGMDHGRQLKNRTVTVPPPKNALNHSLRVATVSKKDSSCSTKNVPIEGHHTQTTNRGYSRKPDGGFFGS